jgi:hypothetical protein
VELGQTETEAKPKRFPASRLNLAMSAFPEMEQRMSSTTLQPD